MDYVLLDAYIRYLEIFRERVHLACLVFTSNED